MTATKLDPKTRRRVEKVIRYLDGEPTADMVALYVESAVENEGSLDAALRADEKAMRAEGFES